MTRAEWDPVDWDARVRGRHICQYCGLDGRALGRHDLHTYDHLIPKKAGGLNVPDNVVVSCFGCNNLKAAFDPREGKEGLPREELIRRARIHIEAQSRYWEPDFRQMLQEAGRELTYSLGSLSERAYVVGPLTRDEHNAIREAADSRGITAEALILQWITERLHAR
jgi:hypothetical protein